MEQSEIRQTAYSYIRMSSQQQMKGDSLRRQLELSRKYAAENNLILDESLTDIGISAWTGANVQDGALGRFLQLIQSGLIKRGSYLLVESLDRLSRQQVRNAIGPFIDIINAGVTIVTLADKQVYSETTVDENWTQLMMSLAIMSRAHEESQTKSKRLKEAHANKKKLAAQGIGRYSHNMWGWIDQIEVAADKFKYQLNQNAATVRRIYEMADAGLGQLVITRKLNDEGIATFRRSKKGWQQPNVGSILRNEAVIGTYQPTHAINGKATPNGPPIKNYLPAAIPEELFWRVQRNKQRRASSGRKGKQLTNLFTSLCVCQHCNGPIRVRLAGTGGKTHRHLHCDNRYRAAGCPSVGGGFRYDILEAAILDKIKEFDIEIGTGRQTADREVLLHEIMTKEIQLGEMEKRKAKLLRALELSDGDAAMSDILSQLSERRTTVEQLTTQLAEMKGDLARIDAEATTIASAVERLQLERLIWSTGSDDEVYASRSRVSAMMHSYIDVIAFDFNRKTYRISIGGHLVLYEFYRDGRLLLKIDNRSLVRKHGVPVIWKDKDESGHAVEGTGKKVIPMGWSAETLTTTIPQSRQDPNAHLVDKRKRIVGTLINKKH